MKVQGAGCFFAGSILGAIVVTDVGSQMELDDGAVTVGIGLSIATVAVADNSRAIIIGKKKITRERPHFLLR